MAESIYHERFVALIRPDLSTEISNVTNSMVTLARAGDPVEFKIDPGAVTAAGFYKSVTNSKRLVLRDCRMDFKWLMEWVIFLGADNPISCASRYDRQAEYRFNAVYLQNRAGASNRIIHASIHPEFTKHSTESLIHYFRNGELHFRYGELSLAQRQLEFPISFEDCISEVQTELPHATHE